MTAWTGAGRKEMARRIVATTGSRPRCQNFQQTKTETHHEERRDKSLDRKGKKRKERKESIERIKKWNHVSLLKTQ